MEKQDVKRVAGRIRTLKADKKYGEIVRLAENMNLNRINNGLLILDIVEAYEMENKKKEAKDTLLQYYDVHGITGRNMMQKLIELCIETGDISNAVGLCMEFENEWPQSSISHLMRYQIAASSGGSLEEQIYHLEKYKEAEFEERWAYELAKLYERNNQREDCANLCHEIILFFGQGRYVERALHLKDKVWGVTEEEIGIVEKATFRKKEQQEEERRQREEEQRQREAEEQRRREEEEQQRQREAEERQRRWEEEEKQRRRDAEERQRRWEEEEEQRRHDAEEQRRWEEEEQRRHDAGEQRRQEAEERHLEEERRQTQERWQPEGLWLSREQWQSEATEENGNENDTWGRKEKETTGYSPAPEFESPQEQKLRQTEEAARLRREKKEAEEAARKQKLDHVRNPSDRYARVERKETEGIYLSEIPRSEKSVHDLEKQRSGKGNSGSRIFSSFGKAASDFRKTLQPDENYMEEEDSGAEIEYITVGRDSREYIEDVEERMLNELDILDDELLDELSEEQIKEIYELKILRDVRGNIKNLILEINESYGIRTSGNELDAFVNQDPYLNPVDRMQAGESPEEDLEECEGQTNDTQVREAQVSETQTNKSAQTKDTQADDTQINEAQVSEAQTNDTQVSETQTNVSAQTSDIPTSDTQADKVQAEADDTQANEVQTDDTQVSDTQADKVQAEADEAQTKDTQVDDAQINEAQVSEAQVSEAQADEAQTNDSQSNNVQSGDTQKDLQEKSQEVHEKEAQRQNPLDVTAEDDADESDADEPDEESALDAEYKILSEKAETASGESSEESRTGEPTDAQSAAPEEKTADPLFAEIEDPDADLPVDKFTECIKVYAKSKGYEVDEAANMTIAVLAEEIRQQKEPLSLNNARIMTEDAIARIQKRNPFDKVMDKYSRKRAFVLKDRHFYWKKK